MTNQELAKIIRDSDNWVSVEEEVKDLCDRANLLDEYNAADGETFESVIEAAAEKLGVQIY